MSDQAEKVNIWRNKLHFARRVQEEADKKYGFTDAMKMYRGEYAQVMPSFVSNVDIIPIEEVYSYVKTFLPSVYSRDPHISLTPHGSASIAGAKINELVLNAYWRDLRLKKEIRRVIVDAVLAEGWLAMGYSAVFGSIEPDEGEPLLEPSEYIKDESIFAERVSWKIMLRDPAATDGIHDARWVARKFIKPLDAIRSSGLLKHAGEIQPTVLMADPDGNKLIDSKDDSMEYGEYTMIWDRDTRRIYAIAEGVEKFLLDKEWPYEFEGFPFELLRFNENPDEPYARNLIQPWIPQLWEKMKIRAMQMDHLKRFNRQLSIEEGAMTPVEMEKLKMGQTATITKRKKGSNPPVPIAYPAFQQDVYAVENRIDNDKDVISNQPNAVRAAPQKTQSRTLGEVDRLLASFNNQQALPQAIIEEFSTNVAYKLLALIQEYLPGRKFVRAAQKDVQEVIAAFPDKFDGNGFFVTKEDLQGAEFDIEVRVGSTLPQNRETKIDTMVSLLKLGASIGIQPGGKVSLVIGKNIMSEFEQKEIEDVYQEEIRKLEVAEIVQRQAQREIVAEKRRRVEDLRQEVNGIGGGAGGV